MDEYSREPCPWRVVDDAGGAFAMGLIGGGIFHSIKGYRNAPKGFSRRLVGSLNGIKSRAPHTGGSFAMWGGMFSVIDCSIAHIRKKEDPWNSIASGAITGAILAVRQGTGAMIGSGIIGAILLSFMEGVNILFARSHSDQFRPISPLDMPFEGTGEQANQNI